MKKRMSLLLVIAMSLAMLVTGCGSSSNSSSANESSGSDSGSSDEFRVGMECGYAPFNWTQSDDSNGGVKVEGNDEYDVQIAQKIADGLGKKLVIVKTEWDGLVPAVQSGKIDAIIAGMSPTAERKESIDFTDVYYTSDLVMVVKKGGKYENATKLSDFKGATITGQLNTFHYTVIDQIDGVKKDTAMDNFPAMRVALESGKIDGYVSERPEGISATSANKNFAMVEFKEGQGFKTSDEDTAIAVGLKKDSDLKDKINKILAGISEDERKDLMDQAIKDQPASEDN